MEHLEGNFTLVLYIGRKVPKGKVLIQVQTNIQVSWDMVPFRRFGGQKF